MREGKGKRVVLGPGTQLRPVIYTETLFVVLFSIYLEYFFQKKGLVMC